LEYFQPALFQFFSRLDDHAARSQKLSSPPSRRRHGTMLEQRGQLSIDDDVRRWVPERPDYGRPIRVRNLLQHTSGLRDERRNTGDRWSRV
jgi:hypothetical protein